MNRNSWLAVDWTTRIVASTLLAAMPLAVGWGQAGRTGNGFLFHRPSVSVTFRGGYSLASASGDLFALQEKQLTIGPRGFDALSLGADVSFDMANRLDIGFSVDGTTRSHRSSYRDWQDNTGQPIQQTTSLNTIGLSANLKYNLRDRGRAISNFAWVPAQYVPYIGVGGGMMNFDFNQKGDFIDFSKPNTNVFTDELDSRRWTAMGQLFSGFAYNLGARTSLITEARYTYASAKLNKDYSELGRIDLSGLSLNVGTSIRF